MRWHHLFLFLVICAGCQDDNVSESKASKQALDAVANVSETLSSEDSTTSEVKQTDTLPPAKTEMPTAYLIESTAELEAGDFTTARVGDFVIANKWIQFVIRGDGGNFYLQELHGGGIVDAGAGDLDRMQELLPIVNLVNSVGPGTVEVTSDGSDGVAVLTVSAKLIVIPIVNAFVGGALPQSGNITIQYRLGADHPSLEINVTPNTGANYTPGLLFFLGGDMSAINQQEGYTIVSGPTVSYGFSSLSQLKFNEIEDLTFLEGSEVAEGETWRTWLTVSKYPSNVLAEALRLRSEPIGTVSGVVDDPDAVVSVYAQEGQRVTQFTPQSDGSFGGALPVGLYTLVAEGPGRISGASVEIDVVEDKAIDSIALSAQKPASLVVTLSEPARLHIVSSSATWTQPMTAGESALPLAPGDYTITALRGFEYEVDEVAFSLAEGEQFAWKPTLQRVVDTTGWIASDFHLHSEWSTDSNVPLRDRILACAAEGVEYAVSTDHDIITDYRPFILPSLKDRIVVANGVETSTAFYGHINSWPHSLDTNKPGRGAPVWFGKDFPELMAALGAGTPGRVVQANHPRRGSSALFDIIGFDPANPDLSHISMFTFNAVELYNSGGVDAMEEVLIDWFALLNNGLQVAATGVSDSHRIGSLCGNARTYVQVADDNPASVNVLDIDAAILTGRTLVTSGPFLTLDKSLIDGKVHVRVSAPSWLPVDTVRLYTDGQEDALVELKAYDNNPVRLDDDIALLNTDAKWVVAVARSDSTPKPHLKSAPRAVSPVLKLK